MTPEDLIDELSHNVVLAPDGPELECALNALQSALQEHCYYLESVSAHYLLSLPLAIRKRLSNTMTPLNASRKVCVRAKT